MTNATSLDDVAALSKLDPGGMLVSVAGLPAQCREAWSRASGLRLPESYQDVDRIAVLGMGGSAIAGDLWRVLLQRESDVPVFNVRQYDLPPYVDERTLVIASSFSGQTEEVLSSFKQALKKKSPKIVITSGGELLTTARANGVPAFSYEFGGEPRAAIGWTLMPMLAIGEALSLTNGIERDVDEAITAMEQVAAESAADVPEAENGAKQLARQLHDKLPVIYGAGPLTEVAHRWKTQLNESAKTWAFYEELPELHHNAVVSFDLPTSTAKETAVVFLESATLVHKRVNLRYQYTKDLLKKAGVATLSADAGTGSALAQMMSLVLLGDYVSTYLAFLYGVDPTPTTVIDELKAWLGTQK
ncbi:MAG: bifunctional phosphoglucose/phosphomannose isomerase [Chloroflexota bacterium]